APEKLTVFLGSAVGGEVILDAWAVSVAPGLIETSTHLDDLLLGVHREWAAMRRGSGHEGGLLRRPAGDRGMGRGGAREARTTGESIGEGGVLGKRGLSCGRLWTARRSRGRGTWSGQYDAGLCCRGRLDPAMVEVCGTNVLYHGIGHEARELGIDRGD